MTIITDKYVDFNCNWEQKRLEMMAFVSQELNIIGGQNSWTAAYIKNLEHCVTELESKIHNQREGFAAQLSIFESMGKFPKIEEVFQNSIGYIRDITGFPTIGMRYYERDNRCFHLMAYSGFSPKMIDTLTCLKDDLPFLVKAMNLKTPFLADVDVESSMEMGFKRLICVPFVAAGIILGTMELTTSREYNWNEDELRWFKIIGHLIGNLIFQAQLGEKLETLATLRERGHLAQEIHDGLAQMIGSINVWSQEAELSLGEMDLEEVKGSISNIEQVAQEAYTYIRKEILDLRELERPNQGILYEIDRALTRFQQLWGINTSFIYDPILRDSIDPHLGLTSSTETQLLRVIQEALTNIHRHSIASNLYLSIEAIPEKWLVTIRDDGVGFDSGSVSEDHLGLTIMDERMTHVGGSLEVISKPGSGTLIKIELPKRM
jgi:signal transduction histidine kinase